MFKSKPQIQAWTWKWARYVPFEKEYKLNLRQSKRPRECPLNLPQFSTNEQTLMDDTRPNQGQLKTGDHLTIGKQNSLRTALEAVLCSRAICRGPWLHTTMQVAARDAGSLIFRSAAIFTWVFWTFVQSVVSLSFKLLAERPQQRRAPAWYMWGRRIRGQVTSISQRGGQCPRQLLQLVSCHQAKAVLIANSWTAKGPANERRDGVMVFAEHGSRGPVQIRRSLGPVFVWGSQSGPSRDRDLEDLSRASAAFVNKLVGSRRCAAQRCIAVNGGEVHRELSLGTDHICRCFIGISLYGSSVTSVYCSVPCLC